MNKKVSVTELVAFVRCERKAELIQQGKRPENRSFNQLSPSEKGIVTHAIIDRRNRSNMR